MRFRGRRSGTIAHWDDERGFGFIATEQGGERVFVHATAFQHRDPAPSLNQRVSFAMATDRAGRACAAQVLRPGERRVRGPGGFARAVRIGLPLVFFSALGMAVVLEQVPLMALWFYLGASAVTFLVYVMDKSAARRGRWRTAEDTLHLLSLAGGWPGALLAQQRIRHKSSKRGFQWVFWLTVLINLAALGWLVMHSAWTLADVLATL